MSNNTLLLLIFIPSLVLLVLLWELVITLFSQRPQVIASVILLVLVILVATLFLNILPLPKGKSLCQRMMDNLPPLNALLAATSREPSCLAELPFYAPTVAETSVSNIYSGLEPPTRNGL